jgi:predicted Zn-dependent protease
MPAPISFWRRLLATLLAGLMLLAGPAGAQVRLPSLGESASADLSVGAERRIGEQIMREARRDPEYLDDPVLLEYLQSVFQPLLAAARHQGNIEPDVDAAFAWEPFLVRDRSVNAFALPGGYIGVHLGLIAITTTPDQLASVLAHELSHVTQRHIARSIAPQERASVMAIAAMILGIIAASRSGNADVANAAIMGGQGAAIQAQLNYSRDIEREADRMGYGLLADAGFSPSGMSAMFEKMDIATRLNDNGGFPYLRSHPLTTERISEARNRTLLSNAAPTRPTLLHSMMQQRSRVLMADGTQDLLRLAGSTLSPQLNERVGALYGGAFAASLLKDHARAQALLAQAQAQAATAAPAEPAAQRALQQLQVQLMLARGDAPAALAVLDAQPAAANDRPSLLLRAQATLDLRRSQPEAAALPLRASTEALQTWVAERPQDALAWEMLAASADSLGLRLRSMRAAAEARAVVGDINGAIDRLRAAQASTRTAAGQDFIEASVIDARIRQLMAQKRQLAIEARAEGRSEPSLQ